PSAGVHTRHGFEPPFDAGEEAADGANLVEHGSVRGQRRRTFRRAVAFENAHAEAIRPELADVVLELLRAREDVAHGKEVIWMRAAGVAGEERVRAENDRGVGL